MLLPQFLLTIRQISSEFFIFQQDSAPANRALEAISFSPYFAKCWTISKLCLKLTQRQICNKVKVKPHLNHIAKLCCDVPLIRTHDSGCFCFLPLIFHKVTYTVSQKDPTFKLFVAVSNLNRLSKILRCWKRTKFATKPVWHYPSHLRHVSTLPSEIKNSNFLQMWKKTQKNCIFNRLQFCYSSTNFHIFRV